MKKLSITSAFMLITFLCIGQTNFLLGGGPNVSWYRAGDAVYKGIKHAEVGVDFNAGFKTKLHRSFDLNYSVHYIHFGAANPIESYNSPNTPTEFSTYSVLVPISISCNIGDFHIGSGIYGNYNVYAKNREFFGGGFGWNIKHWDYFHRMNGGLAEEVGVWLNPIYLNINSYIGIFDVRDNYTKYGYKMKGNKDFSLALNLAYKF